MRDNAPPAAPARGDDIGAEADAEEGAVPSPSRGGSPAMMVQEDGAARDANAQSQPSQPSVPTDGTHGGNGSRSNATTQGSGGDAAVQAARHGERGAREHGRKGQGAGAEGAAQYASGSNTVWPGNGGGASGSGSGGNGSGGNGNDRSTGNGNGCSGIVNGHHYSSECLAVAWMTCPRRYPHPAM